MQRYDHVGTDEFGALALAPVIAAPGVPEPASWAMMLAGLGLVGMAIRRRGLINYA